MGEVVRKNISVQNEGITEERMQSEAGKLYQSLSDIGKLKNIPVSVEKDSIGTLHPQFTFGEKTIHLYIQSTGAKVGDAEGREMQYQVTLNDILLVPEYKEALDKSGINYYIAGGIELQDMLNEYGKQMDLGMVDINTLKKELEISVSESESSEFRSLLNKYCEIINVYLSDGIISSTVYKKYGFQVDLSVIGKENFEKITKNPTLLVDSVKNMLSHKDEIENKLADIIKEYKIKKNHKEIEKKKEINKKKDEL